MAAIEEPFKNRAATRAASVYNYFSDMFAII